MFENKDGIGTNITYYNDIHSKRTMKQYKIDLAKKYAEKERMEKEDELDRKEREWRGLGLSEEDIAMLRESHLNKRNKDQPIVDKKKPSVKAKPKKSIKHEPKKSIKHEIPQLKIYKRIKKAKIKNKDAIRIGKEKHRVVPPVYTTETTWRNTDYELQINRKINGKATGIDDMWLEDDKYYKGPTHLISSSNRCPGNLKAAIICDRSFNPEKNTTLCKKFMKWVEDNNFESTEYIVENGNTQSSIPICFKSN